MWRRNLSGNALTWCPERWRHAEAIARLEAPWRAWEHLRLDPALGMSVWLRDHADHHMVVLLLGFDRSDLTFGGPEPDPEVPCPADAPDRRAAVSRVNVFACRRGPRAGR